jgi:hypothetical protein
MLLVDYGSLDLQRPLRRVLPLGAVAFAAHPGLPPGYSHGCWTPWSVFQDGSELRCAPRSTRVPDRRQAAAQVPPPGPLLRNTRAADVRTVHTRLPGCSAPAANADSLPWEQFHALFAPFPRFFSSFPHGTCLLSVSCQYLALDGLYHPLWAAFPSNPTRLGRMIGSAAPTGLSPSVAARSRALGTASPLRAAGLQLACAIPKPSSSRFTRRYWGNPC